MSTGQFNCNGLCDHVDDFAGPISTSCCQSEIIRGQVQIHNCIIVDFDMGIYLGVDRPISSSSIEQPHKALLIANDGHRSIVTACKAKGDRISLTSI